jgi:predicted nucleic acid-binding protein
MLDSTAAVAAERQGKNARQLLESVALETGDDEIAVSVVTLLELAHGIARADTNRAPRPRPESGQGFPNPSFGSLDWGYGVGTANVRHFQMIAGPSVIRL